LRLITRLIFCWFLKEKQFIADHFFDPDNLKKYLLDFNPNNPQQSQYYKAILQNLFFATLNVETTNREFRTNHTYQGKNSDHFDHSRYRSVDSFYQKENALEELFKDVPFLNGGLFECLDYKDVNKKEHRIDYFTDHPQKSKLLDVPNQLFFADDIIVDLSKWYNDLKQNKQKIDGLITLLNHYKFTVEENTPLEEEVALDPELLGKVFENLLAEFNDESQTTKRKETGSFYTPRAIVSYMVAESLKNYFTTQLQTYYPQTLPALLEQLFDDNPKEIPTLNTQQKEHFLEAISQLTILDPACGSGAYPMGILHQLTHLLQKIDPDNQLWFEKIVKKLPVGLREDFKKQHDNQRIDYVRKLGIIFDTIYGVDIQPIAIHIAKLRFFISLIIEQQKDEHLPNFGIQTLPNLEFKFVCANTLIGINLQQIAQQMERDGRMFGDPLNPVLTQIDDLRKDFFETENQKDKNKLKEQFEGIQITLKSTLNKALANDPKLKTIAQLDQLTQWQPFNDHHSTPFFDPLYMFGIKQGFDIVIGNPPYVKEYTHKDAFDGLRNSPYYQGKMDLWYLFVCHNLDLLKEQTGIICFIATNNWTTNSGASKMRNRIIKDATIEKLLDFGSYMVFETADVQTMIMLFGNNKNNAQYNFDYRRITTPKATLEDISDLLNAKQSSNNEFLHPTIVKNNFIDQPLTFSSNEVEIILVKIKESQNFMLDETKEVAQGMVFPQDYLNKSNQKQLSFGQVGQGIFVLSNQEKANLGLLPNEEELVKPYYTTKQLRKWLANTQNEEWIIYTDSRFKRPENIAPYPNIKKHLDQFQSIITSDNKPYGLHRSRDEYFFKGEKIIALRKCVGEPIFTYTNFDCYVSATFYVIKSNRINQKFLVALLNSRLIAFWLKNKGKMQGNNYQLDKEPLLNIPILKPNDTIQQVFVTIVDYLLFLKKQTDLSTIYATYFEQIINGMVYELYFEEAVTAAKRNIIPHTQQLPDINTLTSDEEKLAMLTNLFETLYHQDHPIRNAVFFMDSIPEIKIIMGK
jgi:adenine-specific DNA-methyltransferase